LNAIAGYPIRSVTPYVLAGTGWGFNGAGDKHKNTQTLWNVGGGMMVNLNRNWQLDARYRYVESWDGNRAAENLVGMGLNYRF
jgi:opacity protein-like surface antigen